MYTKSYCENVFGLKIIWFMCRNITVQYKNWKVLKQIMHEGFWTTIYVQILLFFVTQILIHCNFFSIWPILVIFMDKAAQTQYFWAIKNFFEKRVKRGTCRNFCKICPKFKKFQFFVEFQYIVPFLPFFALLLKNGSGNIFLISTLFLGRKTPI